VVSPHIQICIHEEEVENLKISTHKFWLKFCDQTELP
jgi:hypothetical protein